VAVVDLGAGDEGTDEAGEGGVVGKGAGEEEGATGTADIDGGRAVEEGVGDEGEGRVDLPGKRSVLSGRHGRNDLNIPRRLVLSLLAVPGRCTLSAQLPGSPGS
jgi:hypothetical protein